MLEEDCRVHSYFLDRAAELISVTDSSLEAQYAIFVSKYPYRPTC